MTCKETYRAGLALLEQRDIPDAGFDCLQLFAEFAGISRTQLLTNGHQPLDRDRQERFLSAVNRRCQGEPLQYIIGEWEFYSLPFTVGPGVLIPRGDTEILVDEALRLLEGVNSPRVADLCTGSGCVAISIAKHRPDGTVCAVEWSNQAADYCQKNITRHQADNVSLVMQDVLQGPGDLADLDLIVSNPPYIPTLDIAGLSDEVQQEPVMALDGGEDGLTFYRCFTRLWAEALKPEGMMALEVGIHQAQEVARLLEQVFEQVYIVPDLNKVPRVVLGMVKI